MPDARSHVPVMADGVLEVIAPDDHEIIVDGTFGAGGYSQAFLEAAKCIVYGIDRDPAALKAGEAIAAAHKGRLTLLSGRFGDMERLLAEHGINNVDGIALDLGVSSMQLDDPTRGFSFQSDGPLDMRMQGDLSDDAPTAADVVNTMEESKLADILWRYGEERRSRRIAKAIVRARSTAPITRTHQLSKIIEGVLGKSRKGKIHPSTRTFQALRIYVNDELGELERGLKAAERLLHPNGRLAVVSFHSLEDRLVKIFLRERGGLAPSHSRHLPEAPNRRAPSFKLMFRGAKKPGDDEVERNPRSRSARLRAAMRTASPAWGDLVGAPAP